MKTPQEILNDCKVDKTVGKISPSFLSIVYEAMIKYGKCIQEDQIKECAEEVIEYVEVDDDSGMYFNEEQFIKNCKRVIE